MVVVDELVVDVEDDEVAISSVVAELIEVDVMDEATDVEETSV